MNLKFLREGVAVTSIEVKGDQSSVQKLTVAHESGAAVAGQEVVFSTSALIFIDKLKGLLDSTGKLAITVGPSFGAKGDVQVVARHKNKTATLNIRFV